MLTMKEVLNFNLRELRVSSYEKSDVRPYLRVLSVLRGESDFSVGVGKRLAAWLRLPVSVHA
jgi:hypothetical protein